MGQQLRVVVADDEPTLRELMVRWLSLAGHAVTAVADGLELVAACRRRRPDLVVSDVRMPGLDGLGAAAVLRDELALPVVLVSGAWTAEQIDRATELGAVWLNKPVPRHALAAAVAAACSGGHPGPLGVAPARPDPSNPDLC